MNKPNTIVVVSVIYKLDTQYLGYKFLSLSSLTVELFKTCIDNVESRNAVRQGL